MSDFAGHKRLNEAFQYVEDELLELVEQEKVTKRKRPLWAVCSTVAACICVILVLPVSAMVYNWFGIRDLFVPDPNHEYHLISLSGYQGSPEAEAHREWNEFLQNYDTDHKILDSIGNDVFIAEGREDWFLYRVYSYEMGEKLDEIAKKYGLKLHTEMNLINQEELMNRVGGCFMDKEALTWAYMYEDGYFHVEGDVRLEGLGKVDFQFIRCVKGTFNDVVLRFEETEECEEWQYMTPDGEPVLLVITPGRALIFADYTDCFISVNVLCGSDLGMTRESLQELADRIDFGILKEVKVPDMRGDSVVEPTDAPAFSELMRGEVGKLGTGILAYTIPHDDTQDYKLCFFADENLEHLEIEDADYIFPDAKEGNIPIGTFQTFEVFRIGDIGTGGDHDILLVGIYGWEQRLLYDARVYKWNGEGYSLDAALTQEWNEKFSNYQYGEAPFWTEMSGEDYSLDAALTQEWNEKYSNYQYGEAPFWTEMNGEVGSFENLMGFSGDWSQQEVTSHFYRRTYYADIEQRQIAIGESFGYEIDDYIYDLDGDGVTELICNVTYGDGAEQINVYRIQDGVVEKGTMNEEAVFSGEDIWWYAAVREKYDAAQKKIILTLTDREGKQQNHEQSDYANFRWEKYMEIPAK